MRQNGRLVSESSTNKNSTGNILTRSWARISGRKKRSERHSSIEEATEVVVVEESSPSTSNGQQIPWKLADKPDKSKPFFNRGMDKFRKSLRKKFGSSSHLSKTETLPTNSTTLPISSSSTTDDTIKTPWGLDEKAVRLGTCKFNVKYLGSCEVYESRGVHVCEGALQHLKNKKRITKAILYISGDGLRVVDRETNRGLIVDQTIEKVSFCAPDRNNEKGFAYICREGTTRRWMCHGFLTTKESGERVSHAVGCAFTICLEQKKKREAEQAAAKNLSGNIGQSSKISTDLNSVWDIPPPQTSDSTNFAKNNLAYASFRRQLSISERKQDPQTAIVNEPPKTTPTRSTINESIAKPRPHANPAVFDRQGSFKVPNVPQAAFKRFNSLRTDLLSHPNLDSTRLLNTEPIYEGDEWPETSLSSNPLPVSTSLQFNHISEGNKENTTNNFSNWVGISNPTCQSTPVHNSKNVVSEGKNSPSKAEEWLEQTFRSLSVQDSPRSIVSTKSTPNQIVQSESIDFLDFSSPTQPQSSNSQFPPMIPLTRTEPNQLQTNRYQLPPIMPSNKPVYDFGNATTTDSASSTVPIQKSTFDHVSNDLQQNSDPIKSHSRKGSSTKRIIEYQILEETDVPLSPPRTTPAPPPTSSTTTTKQQELDAFGQPIFVPNLPRAGPSISDPFDVKWSTEVLKSTTTTTDNRYSTTPMNPFSSESAPVNV